MIIPKYSRKLIPVELEGHPQEEQLLAECIPTWPHRNVLVTRGVVNLRTQPTYCLELRNLGDEDVTLDQGELIATLTPVESVAEIDETPQDRVGFVNFIQGLNHQIDSRRTELGNSERGVQGKASSSRPGFTSPDVTGGK